MYVSCAFGLAALRDALAEDLDLPFDASTQLAIDLFVGEPALRAGQSRLADPCTQRAFAVHFLDRVAHEQQPQGTSTLSRARPSVLRFEAKTGGPDGNCFTCRSMIDRHRSAIAW